jgi:hypothetical protein
MDDRAAALKTAQSAADRGKRMHARRATERQMDTANACRQSVGMSTCVAACAWHDAASEHAR